MNSMHQVHVPLNLHKGLPQLKSNQFDWSFHVGRNSAYILRQRLFRLGCYSLSAEIELKSNYSKHMEYISTKYSSYISECRVLAHEHRRDNN